MNISRQVKDFPTIFRQLETQSEQLPRPSQCHEPTTPVALTQPGKARRWLPAWIATNASKLLLYLRQGNYVFAEVCLFVCL